jgi:hypothetical protein
MLLFRYQPDIDYRIYGSILSDLYAAHYDLRIATEGLLSPFPSTPTTSHTTSALRHTILHQHTIVISHSFNIQDGVPVSHRPILLRRDDDR